MTESMYQKFEAKFTEEQFEGADKLFSSVPISFAPSTPEQYVSGDGAISFNIIGQKPKDPGYSDIMNENMDILLSMGGLVNRYMTSKYPKATPEKLDFNAWNRVISAIPALAAEKSVNKQWKTQVAGVKISGEFLQMIAKAIITDGASLLTDFQAYLGKMSDVTFSVQSTGQKYKVVTCAYLNYLVDNALGGYYDRGAIALKEIYFNTGFQELNGVSFKAQNILIDMQYNEAVYIVPTRRYRTGGDLNARWEKLKNKDADEAFENAENLFNAPSTPQDEIKPLLS